MNQTKFLLPLKVQAGAWGTGSCSQVLKWKSFYASISLQRLHCRKQWIR